MGTLRLKQVTDVSEVMSTLTMSSGQINQALESRLKIFWLIVDSIVQHYSHIWPLQSKFPLCSFLVLCTLKGVGAKV